jgi:transcriptional regulator with XRE-family HTH domain
MPTKPLPPVARFIRERRETLQLSLQDVAELFGLSYQAIAQREKGVTKVKLSEVPRFAEILQVPPEQLTRLILGTAGASGKIPVVNRTAAGGFIDNAEWGVNSTEGYTYVDRDIQTEDGDLFALVVDGSSMAPTLLDRDLVICKPVPQDADRMPPPRTVVYIRMSADSRTPGGMLCRWNPQRDGTYLLEKDNPAYPSVVVSREHVEQFAVVVQRRTPFRS